MATMIKSSADTQNQLWAGDKSRFGFKMLEKMGWSEGKGLGTKEDGQTSHVKMKMKTNTLGVGADVGQNDRWNTVTNDYAGVLAKLSAAASPQKAGKDKAKVNTAQPPFMSLL
jgi:Pin2-interacting protein X1